MNIEKDILKLAEEINPLNGFRKAKAINVVNKILRKHTSGFFTDEYWKPIQETWSELTKEGIDYELDKTQYFKDKEGNPNRKEWYFTVYFINNRGKKNTLYGLIVASGAGSIDYPLDRYDVVAYAS